MILGAFYAAKVTAKVIQYDVENTHRLEVTKQICTCTHFNNDIIKITSIKLRLSTSTIYHFYVPFCPLTTDPTRISSDTPLN